MVTDKTTDDKNVIESNVILSLLDCTSLIYSHGGSTRIVGICNLLNSHGGSTGVARISDLLNPHGGSTRVAGNWNYKLSQFTCGIKLSEIPLFSNTWGLNQNLK